MNIKEFLKKKNIVISAKRYGIDALGAMAQGLFASLLIGTILNTLGTQLHIPALSVCGGYATDNPDDKPFAVKPAKKLSAADMMELLSMHLDAKLSPGSICCRELVNLQRGTALGEIRELETFTQRRS